jgi:hypothetical protein
MKKIFVLLITLSLLLSSCSISKEKENTIFNKKMNCFEIGKWNKDIFYSPKLDTCIRLWVDNIDKWYRYKIFDYFSDKVYDDFTCASLSPCTVDQYK